MAWPTCLISRSDGASVGMMRLKVRGREERFAEDTGQPRYLRLDVCWPTGHAAKRVPEVLLEWREARRILEVQDEQQSWTVAGVRIASISTPPEYLSITFVAPESSGTPDG